MMKRRTFIQYGALGTAGALLSASSLLSWSPRTHAATLSRTYYIRDGYITQSDGVSVYFKGFSNSSSSLSVPSAPIIAQEGDTIQITLVNMLSTPHNFYVNGMADSGTVNGGQTKTFSFTASKVGSHLFYDRLNAPYNRLAGLHGALAVMPNDSSTQLYAGSPSFVKQYAWVMTEIDPVWNEQVRRNRRPGSAFNPRYFTINGRSMRVPGHPDYANPAIDSGYNPDTRLEGKIGDRSLVRILNAGMCTHSVHFHANHVEWLARNGQIRSSIWRKDTLMLPNNLGSLDVIFPFEAPPDAHPPVTTGHYPMHLHDEQTQTAGGGLYQFGSATTIAFK